MNNASYSTTIRLYGHSHPGRFAFMRAITHISASLAASAGTFALFGPEPAAGLLLAGGFMDIDHIGLYSRAGLPLRPVALFLSLFRSEGQIERTYCIRRGVPSHWYFPVMHCIELLVLLLAGALLARSALLAGAAAGAAIHLLMDSRSYPCGLSFFSMTWRYLHRNEVLNAWESH